MPKETQAERRRLRAINFIEEEAPEEWHEKLIDLLRPTVGLAHSKSGKALPIGGTKFGGLPDVPEGFEWPTRDGVPLGFLAQLNFAEFSSLNCGLELPERGVISFFISFNEDFQVWGDAHQRERWQTFFWETEPLFHVERSSNDVQILPTIAVKPTMQWSLPDTSEPEIESLRDEQEDDDDFDYPTFRSDFVEGCGDYNQVGGLPFTLQEPMPEQCQNEYEIFLANQGQAKNDATETWRMLFQFDSHQYLEADWIYVGLFYFWIRESDLREKNFQNCWLIQQCD